MSSHLQTPQSSLVSNTRTWDGALPPLPQVGTDSNLTSMLHFSAHELQSYTTEHGYSIHSAVTPNSAEMDEPRAQARFGNPDHPHSARNQPDRDDPPPRAAQDSPMRRTLSVPDLLRTSSRSSAGFKFLSSRRSSVNSAARSGGDFEDRGWRAALRDRTARIWSSIYNPLAASPSSVPTAPDNDTRYSGILEPTQDARRQSVEFTQQANVTPLRDVDDDDPFSQSQFSERQLGSARDFFKRKREKPPEQILEEADDLIKLLPDRLLSRRGQIPVESGDTLDPSQRSPRSMPLPVMDIRKSFYRKMEAMGRETQNLNASAPASPARTGLEDIIDVIHVCEEDLDEHRNNPESLTEAPGPSSADLDSQELVEDIRNASSTTHESCQTLMQLVEDHALDLDKATEEMRKRRGIIPDEFSDRPLFHRLRDIRDFWKSRQSSGELDRMIQEETRKSPASAEDFRDAAEELLETSQMLCAMVEATLGSANSSNPTKKFNLNSVADSQENQFVKSPDNDLESLGPTSPILFSDTPAETSVRRQTKMSDPRSSERSGESCNTVGEEFFDTTDTFQPSYAEAPGRSEVPSAHLGGDLVGSSNADLKSLLESMNSQTFEVPSDFERALADERGSEDDVADNDSLFDEESGHIFESGHTDENGSETLDESRLEFSAENRHHVALPEVPIMNPPISNSNFTDGSTAIDDLKRHPDGDRESRVDIRDEHVGETEQEKFARTVNDILHPVGESRTLSHKSVDILRRAKEQGILEPLESFSDLGSTLSNLSDQTRETNTLSRPLEDRASPQVNSGNVFHSTGQGQVGLDTYLSSKTAQGASGMSMQLETPKYSLLQSESARSEPPPRVPATPNGGGAHGARSSRGVARAKESLRNLGRKIIPNRHNRHDLYRPTEPMYYTGAGLGDEARRSGGTPGIPEMQNPIKRLFNGMHSTGRGFTTRSSLGGRRSMENTPKRPPRAPEMFVA